MVETSRMSTRSRSQQATALSKAAANIQQIARSNRVIASAQVPKSRSSRRLTEDEQKRSVHAVYETRKWLVEEERSLKTDLESHCSHEKTGSHVRYSLVRSLRIWLDDLCANVQTSGDEVSIDSIRQIVQQVKLLRS